MKKQTLKKLLSLALATVMAASLLAGCGNKTEESKAEESSSVQQTSEATSSGVAESASASSEAAPADPIEHDPLLLELGAEPFVSEEVTITIALKQNANIEDYDTNHMTTLIEEASGVNIEFMLIPAGDADQKLQMMVAGGEKLPDIILWGINNALAQQWGAEGYIVPLEDYFEYSSYYAKNAFAKVKEMNGMDIVDYQTLADGHVWQFPSY